MHERRLRPIDRYADALISHIQSQTNERQDSKQLASISTVLLVGGFRGWVSRQLLRAVSRACRYQQQYPPFPTSLRAALREAAGLTS